MKKGDWICYARYGEVVEAGDGWVTFNPRGGVKCMTVPSSACTLAPRPFKPGDLVEWESPEAPGIVFIGRLVEHVRDDPWLVAIPGSVGTVLVEAARLRPYSGREEP